MSDNKYRVRVTKDYLVFSAAHFITFNGNVCERLHGHNWRTAVEVVGPLDENHYVFDFIALLEALKEIVARLDHHMLLPTQHQRIHVTASDHEVEVRFENRRWLFPREDCVLLPVANTTAECLAQWIGDQLQQTIMPTHNLEALRVEVEENSGQWAICEFPLPSDRSG
jgi:6-pyruvoyltetrahydropterin/6-carboxytetrahydropterin synthase